MPNLELADFTIHYEVTCPGDGPTLLLVSGIGEQIGSVEFPEEQCDEFAARGFRVVRMDNRDTGLSVSHQQLPVVDPMSSAVSLHRGEEVAAPPYTIHDMADDVVAVLDDLGVERVHLAGASLGGLIVRWAAISQPDRVASLTVVMSGCAAGPNDDGPTLGPGAMGRMVAMSERHEHEAGVDLLVAKWRWLWGDGYPFDEGWVRARVEHAFSRSYRPEGVGRLLLAAVQTPGLWNAQTEIACPTLVMHGDKDPCFGPDHGREIASRIPGAELWLDSAMGHIMHREQWTEMAARVAALACSAHSD
jgi:pimeloyl-ACP methyl ester carboxylesterase